MGTSQDPDKPSVVRLRRSSLYFTIAWIFVYILALTWSIDPSFRSLSLGVALSFLITGLWHRVKEKPSESRKYDPYKDYQRERRSGTSFFSWSDIGKRFSQKHTTVAQPVKTAADRKLIAGVLIFIASIFGVITISVLFGTGDDPPAASPFFIAEQYYGAGQYDSAKMYYKQVLREDPSNVDALLGYGNALSALDDPDSAIILYDQALAIKPDFDIAQYNKGWVSYRNKDYAQAVTALKALLERNPAYYDAMQLLGDVYYEQRSFEDALRWYEDAYSNGLRSSWLCHVMAYLYDVRGNTSKAIGLYKEALEHDSTITDIHRRLGELLPGDEGQFYRDRAN